jgi:pimeloyl-ACP methyl ester carboxylesterase
MERAAHRDHGSAPEQHCWCATVVGRRVQASGAGYGSTGGVSAIPETRYAKSGDVHIAYQVVSGSGGVDLVVIPPGVSNIEVAWEEPRSARFLQALARFSRVVLFDTRGTGTSDRSIGYATLEERMDDTRAVMDAAGLRRAAVMGNSHGGPMAMLFAATYPERTKALVLFGTFARLLNAPDFGLGWSRETVERFTERWAARWGTRRTLTLSSYCPSKVGDDRFLGWLNRYERQSATPADLLAMIAMDCDIDVRDVLGAIRVPTLVIHRTGDRICRAEQARWIATQIPDAEYVELPGEDHYPFVGDRAAIVAAVERFLTGRTHPAQPDRVLATVLFTDLVSSTQRAAALGDRRWRELLDAHDSACAREIERFGGRWIEHTGDGVYAAFDGPARGIGCAVAIREALRGQGLEVRAGLHTGECERRGERLSGIAVHTAARVQGLAQPGEVLVSRTVSDLIAGSETVLVDRGEHELRGVPGAWRVYRVDSLARQATSS